MGFKILAINPGSTSTKIALYDDEGEALVDALLLVEDDRLLGYQIEPVKYEANKNEKIQS